MVGGWGGGGFSKRGSDLSFVALQVLTARACPQPATPSPSWGRRAPGREATFLVLALSRACFGRHQARLSLYGPCRQERVASHFPSHYKCSGVRLCCGVSVCSCSAGGIRDGMGDQRDIGRHPEIRQQLAASRWPLDGLVTPRTLVAWVTCRLSLFARTSTDKSTSSYF